MTRSELVTALAYRFPELMKADADLAVEHILKAISHTLINGHRVEIRGFGTFALNYRPPRIGRNPKTGERVDVPGKYSPHFRPAKEMRNRVGVANQ